MLLADHLEVHLDGAGGDFKGIETISKSGHTRAEAGPLGPLAFSREREIHLGGEREDICNADLGLAEALKPEPEEAAVLRALGIRQFVDLAHVLEESRNLRDAENASD